MRHMPFGDFPLCLLLLPPIQFPLYLSRHFAFAAQHCLVPLLSLCGVRCRQWNRNQDNVATVADSVWVVRNTTCMNKMYPQMRYASPTEPEGASTHHPHIHVLIIDLMLIWRSLKGLVHSSSLSIDLGPWQLSVLCRSTNGAAMVASS